MPSTAVIIDAVVEDGLGSTGLRRHCMVQTSLQSPQMLIDSGLGLYHQGRRTVHLLMSVPAHHHRI